MSTLAVICAAPDCENPVERQPGRVGRPPIYCSKACRPSLAKEVLTVEVVQDDTEDRQPGRDWIVRLRRGTHTVPVRKRTRPLQRRGVRRRAALLLRRGRPDAAPRGPVTGRAITEAGRPAEAVGSKPVHRKAGGTIE